MLGGGQVRVFAMHHKQDLGDAATYTSIRASLECELSNEVDPYRAPDHPNLVVYNELDGLIYGTEGTRGAVARTASAQLTLVDQLIGQEGAAGIGGVAGGYAIPIAYYGARFGPTSSVPATVQRLFVAITDTMVRAVVENVSALAKKHGVYITFGAPLPVLEGGACAGAWSGKPACPGWHASTSAVDVAALVDPDLGPASTCAGLSGAPCVYVADTPEIDNVELFFAPDGTLYDLQPKVSLTATELNPLGWHQASPSTIHAIGFHGADAARFDSVRIGVGISLDAFETSLTAADPCSRPRASGTQYPYFMECVDQKGVNLFLQPEFNSGSAACASWTDFTEDCGAADASWQPLSWMRSAWYAVQGFPHVRYAVNAFMVGNLFDITGDGQSAIFARDDPRARPGWYAGDRSAALYSAAGVYTDRPDDPRYARFEGPQPGFLALIPWVIPESAAGAAYRVRSNNGQPLTRGGANHLPAGDPGSLQSCEKGLAPGSGVKTGPCAENAYTPTALVADLFPSTPPSAGGGLPDTSRGAPGSGLALLLLTLAPLLTSLRRREEPRQPT